MNNGIQKTVGIVTHKGTLWGGGIVSTILALYTGYQQVGVPAMDRVLIELNGMEDNQEINNKLLQEKITWMKVQLKADHPDLDVDSLFEEIAKDDWWHDKEKSKHGE